MRGAARAWTAAGRAGAAIALLLAGAAPAASQGAYDLMSFARPSSPLSPTDPQQCAALRAEWDEVCGAVRAAHESCLDDHRGDRPFGQGPRGCDIPACDHLHGPCGAFTEQRDAAVTRCDAAVERHRKSEREREEAERRRREEAERARREEAERRERERRDREERREAARDLQEQRDDLRQIEQERQMLAAELIAKAQEERDAAADAFRHGGSDAFEEEERALERQLDGIDARLDAGGDAASAPGAFDLSSLTGPPSAAPAFPSEPVWREAYEAASAGLEQALRAFASDAIDAEMSDVRESLWESFVENAPVRHFVEHVVETGGSPAGATDRIVGDTFDRLFGEGFDETGDELTEMIGERLQTPAGRLNGTRWGAWLGDAIVRQSVTTVMNLAAAEIRDKVVEKVRSGWDVLTGGGAEPPPEHTFERAEYDFWKEAHPANLIVRTAPGRGAAAATGLYDYGTALVERFSAMLGFVTADVEEDR